MLLLVSLACAPDEGRVPRERSADPGTRTDDTAPVDGCRATPAAADRDRVVLVSLPYDAGGGQSEAWASLTLSADGELSDSGTRVEMGRASAGEVVFTPDASLALVATEDGTVAVYQAADGVVVDEGYAGDFYANRVVMDPTGEAAWIVDGNWAENGGGVYRVDIDCATGALSGEVRVVEAKLPSDLLWVDGGALLVGREVPGAAAGDDLARLTWDDAPAFADGVDAFGDDDGIVSDAAVVGEWALLADFSEFSGVPTRVARVRIGETLTADAPVEVEDPVALVPFPDGSARALVASGYGDAYVVLDADAGTADSVTARGVQLPGTIVGVTRGGLDGLVLGSEVGGVRRLQLSEDGVADLGVFSLGDGLDDMPGAIGVAP